MKFVRLFALLVLVSVPVIFLSCQKTTQLGTNVLPGSDFIYAASTDTLTVWAQEEPELPVQTNSQSKYLLGSIKDPIFGNSYAAIYTQVEIPNPGEIGQSTGDSLVVDSTILSLAYNAGNSYYGIPNIPQSIKVYRVTQPMNINSTYYSNQTFSFDPQPIGEKNNYIPNYIDSPIVTSGILTAPNTLGYDTMGPQLRIKLSAQFTQDVSSQINNSNGTFYSNSTFQNFLKGILIAPDTSNSFGSGIMYFDLAANSNIIMYCHYKNSTVGGPIIYFPINSSASATTNYYKHNYTGTPVASLLRSNAKNDSVLYLQSMGGLRAKITIPYLKTLGNVLVNEAQLEVIQLHRNPVIIDSNYSAPQSLELLTDSSNNNYSIEDISNEFLNYGGTRIKTPLASNDTIWEYNVNVSDQVQYILTGNPTNSDVNYKQFTSFFLRTFPNPEIADRIVVGGGNANKYKLVFHIVYTKLK